MMIAHPPPNHPTAQPPNHTQAARELLLMMVARGRLAARTAPSPAGPSAVRPAARPRLLGPARGPPASAGAGASGPRPATSGPGRPKQAVEVHYFPVLGAASWPPDLDLGPLHVAAACGASGA
jgi:hypothetical protein